MPGPFVGSHFVLLPAAATAAGVVSGPGGVGSPMGLLLTLTYAS